MTRKEILARVVMSVVSLIALFTAMYGVAWLINDIGLYNPLDKHDVSNLSFAVGLCIAAYVFARLIEKPFDMLMDLKYPNDVPPKK